MNNMIRKIDKYKCIVFLIAFLPRAVLCLFAYPVSVLSDEVATIAGATIISDMDWSAVVSQAGYYGTGFSVWMAPIFWVTDNPILIYRIVGLICTLMQSLSVLLACVILERLFLIKDKRYVAIAALLCSYLVSTRGILIFNEHALTLMAWIIAWLFMKLAECIDEKREKGKYTLLLIVIMSYSLTIHARAISFWLSLLVMVMFYAWTYRKSFVSLPVMFVGGSIGYIVTQIYVRQVQKNIWLTGNGQTIRNGEISLSGGFENLLDPKNWQACLNIIIGQIHTAGVMTGGLFIILIIVFVHFMWNRLLRKQDVYSQGGELSLEQKLFPFVVFFAAGIAMTVLGQSITWLTGSREVIEAGFENYLYGAKAYTYVRYFLPFGGPFLLAGLAYIYHKKESMLDYAKASWAALIICEIYWLVCIVPYIYHTNQLAIMEFYFPFSLYTFDSQMNLWGILPASIAMMTVFVVFWISLKRKKTYISLGVISGILMYSYLFLGITWELRGMNQGYEVADKSYQVIRRIEDKVELPDRIYVQDLRHISDHQTYYEYQILLNKYNIVPDIPKRTEKEAIVFTNNDEENDWADMGYLRCKLDEGEILLVKGKELQEKFINQGIPLKEY